MKSLPKPKVGGSFRGMDEYQKGRDAPYFTLIRAAQANLDICLNSINAIEGLLRYEPERNDLLQLLLLHQNEAEFYTKGIEYLKSQNHTEV